MITRFAVSLTLLISLAFAPAASGQSATLELGDPVPPLDGKVRWLQGDPAPNWESGKIYVLDFWATWCGPCIAAMPHMNEISQRHEDDGVQIIGVATLPQSGATPVDEWMEQNPDRMIYAVADDIDRRAANSIFFPTGSKSIPRVMIVDREGALAYVGHPQEDFEPTLELVVEGRLTGEKAGRLMAKAQPLLNQANAAAAEGEWDHAFRLIDQIVALDDYLYDHFAVTKYGIMHMQLARHDDAKVYGREIVSEGGELWNNADQLIKLSDLISEPSRPVIERDIELAVKASKRAVELMEESPEALAALAQAYFSGFDFDKAIEAQRRALERAGADHPKRAQLERELEMYISGREGVEKRGSGRNR